MSLTKKDIELITEVINQIIYNKQKTDEEMTKSQVDAIIKSVEINTKIFNEIKIVAENSEKIMSQSDKVLATVTNGIAGKIEKIYSDICTKEGYLPKISAKLTYF
jgi:hypothetical protein